MKMSSGGYKYQIHARSGNIALISGVNMYKSISWEIWHIRQTKKDKMVEVVKDGVVSEKLIPAGTDINPVASDAGHYLWPCKTEDKARALYREKIIEECGAGL